MLRTVLASLALGALLGTCTPASAPAGSLPPPGYNHLAGQQSPYLLQHARNPVDWYPWGEEALAKAKAENKLLVISVGYAACHWCHVMEHESFEDSTVAAVMNEHFVSIKVDREERPDVDEVYMTACQLTARGGCGWPLNAIALPDGRPVWAGTYFPREQWLGILRRFTDLRLSEAGKMEEYAAGLTDELVRQNSFTASDKASGDLTGAEIEAAAAALLPEMDPRRGGTRGAPKFPLPALHEFLLAHHFHTGDPASLEPVTTTLDAMAAGGIYDQLAGGFARYSTDEDWRVPHFEKMLYDNAQLVSLYAHAHQLTGKPAYARVVRETLAFVERKLSDPSGPFYASLDADTEGEEGKTYVWTTAEIAGVLEDPRLARAFGEYYGVTASGNWEGTNILSRRGDAAAIASRHGYASATALETALVTARERLLRERDERPQPALDDKTLTAWNALMITAYVHAYRALGETEYRTRALEAAEFLWREMRDPDGRLFRNYKDGTAAINAFLDDYALLAMAYTELYQVTFAEEWLGRARALVEYANTHFYVPEKGVYRYTSDLDPPLISPSFPVTDAVIPGGNSVMARVQYHLGILTADAAMLQRSRNMLGQMRELLAAKGPRHYANWALLSLEQLAPTYEVAS